MWRKRGGGGFELKTPSNRASRLKGYDAPAVNVPAGSRKAGSGITLLATIILPDNVIAFEVTPSTQVAVKSHAGFNTLKVALIDQIM